MLQLLLLIKGKIYFMKLLMQEWQRMLVLFATRLLLPSSVKQTHLRQLRCLWLHHLLQMLLLSQTISARILRGCFVTLDHVLWSHTLTRPYVARIRMCIILWMLYLCFLYGKEQFIIRAVIKPRSFRLVLILIQSMDKVIVIVLSLSLFWLGSSRYLL